MLSDKMRASMGSSGCQEGLDSRKYLLNKKEETRDSKITNTRHRLHCNWRFLPINSSANSMMIWDLRMLWRKQGLPRWLTGEESACPGRRHRRCRFNPWVRKIPWRSKWQPTPVFLPGKSHGQRSLVGYSPWVRETQTQLSTHTHRKRQRFLLILILMAITTNPINRNVPNFTAPLTQKSSNANVR